MQKQRVALVVITLNEERNIERCLRSVPFADEVILADTGSTDRTCEIAKKMGARVFVSSWMGFGPHKAWAADQAACEWILSLDADEALSPELAAEIQSWLTRDLSEVDAFSCPRKSFHLGRWILHGGWYPDRQIRLFHRHRAQWNAAPLHEKIEAKSKTELRLKKLHHPILHWVFKDLSHQVIANDRYSGLGTQSLIAKGARFSLMKLLFKPIGKFVECYIIKRGFMDGLPGFIIAVGAAYSIFLKFAKLWESENVSKEV